MIVEVASGQGVVSRSKTLPIALKTFCNDDPDWRMLELFGFAERWLCKKERPIYGPSFQSYKQGCLCSFKSRI